MIGSTMSLPEGYINLLSYIDSIPSLQLVSPHEATIM